MHPKICVVNIISRADKIPVAIISGGGGGHDRANYFP